jgi:nucleoside-diphosphate-sugar epimerase
MKALVTGGGGFLGGAVVRKLVERGDAVRSFTRTRYPWLDDLGVEQALGDLADPAAVAKAADGCDIVFHVAAKAGVWGRFADYHRVNVVGTQNVLAACQQAGVGRLVHTSTPSVVYTGPVENGNESLPYPRRYSAAYPRTKAVAEWAVLAANGPDLFTVALRPHLIWGPGDPHLVPRVLARARAGKLKRVGTAPVMVDVTYVDNAADAHLLAADRLGPDAPAAGKAYFISNGEPVDLWAFLDRVLAVAGLPPVAKVVSPWKARLAGRVLEAVYRYLRLPGEPAMTRFVAAQLSTPHWFDISAARRDLGYEPRVSIDEGLKRLAATV